VFNSTPWPLYHQEGAWVGPWASLDACGEEKNLFPPTGIMNPEMSNPCTKPDPNCLRSTQKFGSISQKARLLYPYKDQGTVAVKEEIDVYFEHCKRPISKIRSQNFENFNDKSYGTCSGCCVLWRSILTRFDSCQQKHSQPAVILYVKCIKPNSSQ
jgi:hypothetical protein